MKSAAVYRNYRADISYEQCRAGSCWSVPSHGTMFTGTLPSEHGLHTHNPTFDSLEIGDTFLDQLNGYDTIGISANAYASSSFGFDTLFDRFIDVGGGTVFSEGADVSKFDRESSEEGLSKYLNYLRYCIEHESTGKSLANGIAKLVDQYLTKIGVPKLNDSGGKRIVSTIRKELQRDNPVFVFANIMDAHSPNRPRLGYNNKIHELPGDWSPSAIDIWDFHLSDDYQQYEEAFEALRNLYRAQIDYLDRIISDLIDSTENQGGRETTFIITADHGENLAHERDDRLFRHTSSLSEGVIHVPLEVINPPTNTVFRENSLVSHTKLGKLIAGVSEGEVPDITESIIAAETIGVCSTHRESLDRDDLQYWDRAIRCAYRDDTKIEWDSLNNCRRFKETDGEFVQTSKNKTASKWATSQFKQSITDYKRQAQEADNTINVNDMDESVKTQLQDLGYL